MADVAKMPASVPTGPIGALAGDDGVDRPGDEIRDAGEGKTSRSVATAGRTETAAAAAGDGEGAREGGANANEDDADARATNGARGGGAIAEGAPSANAPPPASGDADRPDSEERDDEDDENDEDADDPSLATSDHDDETPLIPPGGIPPGGADGAPVRRRSMRSAANITQEELSACFHLPSEAACRRLGIGLTVLKRQCRKFGIKRWPFRKMKSLDRLITNVQAGISPGDQNRTLVKSVEELEEQKQRMQECHELDLDDDTKRLQQAYSKANHKARRAAHQTDMGGVGGLLALSGGAEGGLGASSAAGLLSRQPSGGEKTIAEVLEAAKAQAELLRGVASTIPALLPGAAGSSASMAAAVAAAAAAMSAQSGAAVSAATVSALMHASATRDAGGLAAAAGGPTNAPRDKSTRSDKSDGDAVDARNPTDAVVGAWSPARPVKPPAATAEGAARGDRGDARLEELLSASGRDVAFQRSDARGGDEWDDDARDEGEKALAERSAARGAAAKRERRPGWVETRGRPRKHPRRHEEDAAPSPGEAEGDDPLASLAAAALAVKGRGRGRPLGSKNGSGKNAVAKAGAAAPAGGSAVRKSAVTLLVTEHADRVREALNRTIDALVSVDANDREALARGVNEAVGVESLKLRDALNAALGAS